MGSQWRLDSLEDSAWRPTPGLTRAKRAAEQDFAAGGREYRLVPGSDKPVVASVYFRRMSGRRVYAYLRWADNGHTSERFVCEVDQLSRACNLALAWSTVTDRRMLTQDQAKPTTSPPPTRARESWASTETVRRQMRANRSRDTKPERALRSRVHEMGLRYRVATRPLPEVRRTADLVFTKARVAVFLDGCYWHGCADHYRPARTNEEFWREKIARNRQRDAETDQLMHAAGWAVVRVWEHEDPRVAAERVRDAVLSS